MFKRVYSHVWCFDLEWVPDVEAGKKLYPITSLSDSEIMQDMWVHAGATEENPQPMIKLALSRIVSIAAVVRVKKNDVVTLQTASMAGDEEARMISSFLTAVGKKQPQLVGYNSINSDFRILLQRAAILGVQAQEFCTRPDKPWEGVDYFLERDSDWNIDLCRIYGGWQRGPQVPSLHEICTLSGIPGKLGVDGTQVPMLWNQGRVEEIRIYNLADAFSTYLLWLRTTFMGGWFTPEQYEMEQAMVRSKLETMPEMKFYLDAWLKNETIIYNPEQQAAETITDQQTWKENNTVGESPGAAQA